MDIAFFAQLSKFQFLQGAGEPPLSAEITNKEFIFGRQMAAPDDLRKPPNQVYVVPSDICVSYLTHARPLGECAACPSWHLAAIPEPLINVRFGAVTSDITGPCVQCLLLTHNGHRSSGWTTVQLDFPAPDLKNRP